MASDNKYIQQCIDMGVRINAGHYIIDTEVGVRLSSNQTINLTGVTLETMSDLLPSFAILHAHNACNLRIIGGTLIGHTGDGDYTGLVLEACTNTHVSGLVVKGCPGEGIRVSNDCSHITITSADVSYCRGSGICISGCYHLQVDKCKVLACGGVDYTGGIALAPSPGEDITSIYLSNCMIAHNRGFGIGGIVGMCSELHSAISHLRITDCVVSYNAGTGVVLNRVNGVTIPGSTEINYNFGGGLNLVHTNNAAVDTREVKNNIGFQMRQRDTTLKPHSEMLQSQE